MTDSLTNNGPLTIIIFDDNYIFVFIVNNSEKRLCLKNGAQPHFWLVESKENNCNLCCIV